MLGSIRKIFSFTSLIVVIILNATFVIHAEGDKPALVAKAACSISSSTGNIIYAKNKDEKMVPASTTKLLTALIVAEKLDMNTTIKTDQEMEDVAESEVYMQKGEVFKAKDLFYAMLVYSANDAAVALAKATAGSVKEFAKMMNEKAKSLGAVNSHFVNPNGIKVDNHYSTAYDLALIGRAAFDNELVRKAAGTKTCNIPATDKYVEREFDNTNDFLWDDRQITVNGKAQRAKYDGVFAGKTGTWEDDESSIVLGLNSNGVEIVAVILNSTSEHRYGDAYKLLKYSEENAPRELAVRKNEDFGEVYIRHGEICDIDVVAARDGYVRLPEGVSKSLITTKTELNENIEAPIKKGDILGKVNILIDKEKVASIDLIANQSVKTGWFPSYIGISNKQTIVIGCILGFLLIIIFILKVRHSRIKKRKARARQKKLASIAKERRDTRADRERRNWDI